MWRPYSGTGSNTNIAEKCVGIFDGITKGFEKLIFLNTMLYKLVQVRLCPFDQSKFMDGKGGISLSFVAGVALKHRLRYILQKQ